MSGVLTGVKATQTQGSQFQLIRIAHCRGSCDAEFVAGTSEEKNPARVVSPPVDTEPAEQPTPLDAIGVKQPAVAHDQRRCVRRRARAAHERTSLRSGARLPDKALDHRA